MATKTFFKEVLKLLWAYLKKNNLHPGSGKQAILYPRQEDGQGFWQRSNPGLWDGQIPFCSLILKTSL